MSELTDEPTTEEKYAQIESIVTELGDAHSNRTKRDALNSIKAIVAGEVVEVEETEPEDETESVDLSKLTVPELKAFATENEIDLGDATKKADILTVIELSLAESVEGETGPDTTGWHALVTAPDGTVVYDGLCPVPEELVTITPEMLENGEVFNFELTPPSDPDENQE